MQTMANYNEILATIKARYSCRGYSSAPVAREDVERILEAMRFAPSACNRQPWKFMVVTDPAGCNAVFESYDREWIRTAGTFIICLGNHSQAWVRADGKDHTDIDVAIATEHLCLAATSLGLATCWICNFNAPLLAERLSIPDSFEPIAIIPLGYPAEGSVIPEKKRKPLDEIVVWESF